MKKKKWTACLALAIVLCVPALAVSFENTATGETGTSPDSTSATGRGSGSTMGGSSPQDGYEGGMSQFGPNTGRRFEVYTGTGGSESESDSDPAAPAVQQPGEEEMEMEEEGGGETRMRIDAATVVAGMTCPVRAEDFGPDEGALLKADGRNLWIYITQTSPHTAWKQWPGKEEFYPAKEPHGALLTTYVNDAAHGGIRDRLGSLPDGSIIVTRNHNARKMLDAYSVMYKIKDYNPGAGDWFWVKYRPDGRIDAQGRVGVCITCHAAQKDNDYIMTCRIK